MEDFISSVIESVGKYFAIFSLLFFKNERAYIFLFKKNRFKTFKEAKYRYFFFIYTIFLVYLILPLLILHEPHFSNVVFSDIYEFLGDKGTIKYLTVFCIAFLLIFNFLAFLFSKGGTQLSLIKDFSIYMFCIQLGWITILTVIIFAAEKLGLTDFEKVGFLKKLLGYIPGWLLILCSIYYLFVLPFSLIKQATLRKQIDNTTAIKLRLFVFLPALLSIVLFSFIPSEPKVKNYETKFLNVGLNNFPIITIDQLTDTTVRVRFNFIFTNNSEAPLLLNEETAFFIPYIRWNKNSGSIENRKVVADVLYLKSHFDQPNILVKKNEPILVQINSNLTRDVFNDIFFEYPKTTSNLILNLNTIEGAQYNLFKDSVKLNLANQ